MKLFSSGLKTALATAAFALLANPAHAGLVINGVDVGTLDTVIGAIDSAQSGQAYEEAQLEAAILAYSGVAVDVTLASNINTPTGSPTADGSGNRYIDVDPATPGYYVLKFGTPSGNIDMLFMKNEEFLRYLAWSDAQMIAAGIPAGHVQSLSHYAITGSVPSSNGTLSEPSSSTLALLGLALLVGGLVQRRRALRG